jgi:CBS domain-containing protein
MRCSEIMKTDVEACWVMDSIADVAERMRNRGMGFLPVCDDAGEVVGTITDRDIVVRVVARQLSYETPVHQVMSIGAVTCRPQDGLSLAEDRMRRNRKSRLVVVDESRRPIGVISLSDIAERDFTWRTGRLMRDITGREHRFIE